MSSERIELSGLLAIAAVVAATCQTIAIATAPQIAGLTLMDDLVVCLLVLTLAFRIRSAPGLAIYLIVSWTMLMVIGALNSTIPHAPTFVLFRQVTVPAILIMCGLLLKPQEWRSISRLTIWIGILNSVYMTLELGGIRLLNPETLASYERDHLIIRNGLPAYYFYYDDTFGELVRLGGTVLNPPIASLVTGGAFAFLWHDKKFPHRNIFLLLLAIATALTFGRGGVLVAAAAVVLPFLVTRLGNAATICIGAALASAVGLKFAEDGNSAIHAQGLIDGLKFGASGTFGSGFGVTGNHLKALGLTSSSESLFGIAFAAGGVLAIAIVTALLFKLFFAINQTQIWEAAVGIGIVAAALFSESAGALNGTIPLWFAIGVALRKSHKLRMSGIGLPREPEKMPQAQG